MLTMREIEFDRPYERDYECACECDECRKESHVLRIQSLLEKIMVMK